jgi:hypothetical protein
MSGYAEAKPEIARQMIEVVFILSNRQVGLDGGRMRPESVEHD